MPPLVGVAVKVTGMPAQMVVTGVDITTAGTTVVVTVIGGAVEVAVAGEVQGALEVMITVATSPFANAGGVNVAELAPVTLMPLSCH